MGVAIFRTYVKMHLKQTNADLSTGGVTSMAYVIGDDCVKCGSCAAQCPVEAISEGPDKFVIDADACLECGACAAQCPAGAIDLP